MEAHDDLRRRSQAKARLTNGNVAGLVQPRFVVILYEARYGRSGEARRTPTTLGGYHSHEGEETLSSKTQR